MTDLGIVYTDRDESVIIAPFATKDDVIEYVEENHLQGQQWKALPVVSSQERLHPVHPTGVTAEAEFKVEECGYTFPLDPEGHWPCVRVKGHDPEEHSSHPSWRGR